MKTKDDILKEAQDHFGVNVFANDDGITRRIEHYAMDLWAQEVVKNNLVQADVSGSAFLSTTTTKKEGYYSDNWGTYYLDADGKKHLR